MTPSGPVLKEVLLKALEHPEGPWRAAYLDRACGGDVALRREMEALLKAHGEAGGPLKSSTDATSSLGRPAILEGPGTTIGPYKLLQQIGEGGMGVVFMAEQEKPVRRKVALKVIKPGMDTAQVIARFEAERQALAMMDHPNIARVLDVGATDTGLPYFVMELVKGVPITEYCDRNQLSPRERLELFIPTCQAIQHAHQKGIIHRDIKPRNVLVTLHDGQPVPKVIDFGVAKAILQRLTEKTMFTEFGAIIGTLEYMSPEQAEMGALDVDTRSDIYSLGVLLYELLTGTTPLERAKIREAAYAEILRRIREEEPTKPSTRLGESKDALPSISAQRKMEPARLTKLVRGDLDWIVMKSLEKDRTRRYETATGFARDIQRYLEGDAVEASPPSASYKLRKFARKHRTALATAGAFALLMMAATAVSAGLALWANRERDRAVAAEASAKEQQDRALDREQTAIDAMRRYGDVIGETPELKNNPTLAPLRAKLLHEPQEFFKRLRNRLQDDKETTPDSLARLANASFDLGKLMSEIGDKQDALRAFEESLALFERLARENPSDASFRSARAASHHGIGDLLGETGRPAEALASNERARDLFEQLARESPTVARYKSGLAESLNSIGTLQAETGRAAEALASFERARDIYEELAIEKPWVTEYQGAQAASRVNIGKLLKSQGRAAEALASYERARAIYDRLMRENPAVTEYESDLAANDNQIGLLLGEKGKSDKAVDSVERARDLFEKLARENPSVTRYRSGLAESHGNLGKLRREKGQPAEALDSLERARAIYERLAIENPTVIAVRSGLAESLDSIGTLLLETGRAAEALASFERARDIVERLARESPSVLALQVNLAAIHNRIGALRRQTGLPSKALASFERALGLVEPLALEHPESSDLASHLGATLSHMATIDLDERRFGEARSKLTRAIQWQRKALAANPHPPAYWQSLGDHLALLIRVDERLGRADQADQTRREMAEFRASEPAKLALDVRLAAVLNGRATRDEAERAQLAHHAYERSLHASSARLYAEAMANDPGLAEDRNEKHPYNAACAAALAGCGQGKDDPPPDDVARAKLRRQALDWLRGELASWAKVLDSGPADLKATLTPTLTHWKADADLTGIRDKEGLAGLPEAERSSFQQLWADVDRLLARASGGK